MGLNIKNIAITKKANSINEFERLLKTNNWSLVYLNTLQIEDKNPSIIEDIISSFYKKKYSYCIFLSQNAVNFFFDYAKRTNNFEEVLSLLSSLQVISIGSKTTKSLLKFYNNKIYEIKEGSSNGIINFFRDISDKSKNRKDILIPRSEKADDFLITNLTPLGYFVNEFYLYDVKPALFDSSWHLFLDSVKKKDIQVIIFTSPSNVEFFFKILLYNKYDPLIILKSINKIISIGPSTSKQLVRFNISDFIESKEHTLEGIFNELTSLIN